MGANDTQVGGGHYKADSEMEERAAILGLPVMEHWDFVTIRGYNYLQGNASKYLDRYEKKGTPIQDLEKVMHYVQKLIEIEKAKQARREAAVSKIVSAGRTRR